MASSPSNDRAGDVASSHLEGLFALAQIISPSAEDAVELVQRTIRRARDRDVEVGSESSSDEDLRVELYRMLLRERAAETAMEDQAAIEGSADVSPARDLADLRQRLAGRLVDETLPAAFASLSREYRILLMLCDVQGMTCAEAGSVLRVDDESACRHLGDARADLHRAVYAGSTEAERRLLTTDLPRDWMRGALRRMVESELSAVPPTMQPSLLTPGRGPTSASKSDDGPPSGQRDGRSTIQRVGRRMAVAFLVIAVAGLLGYGFSTMTSRAPDVNLISLSASQAGAVEISFQTTSAEQAERYVRDRLSRRITVPAIGDAQLQGISIRDVSDGAEAPVLLYRTTEGPGPIVVYVYSYAFLDAHERRLRLSDDVLNQIESEGHFDLHDLGEEKALIWRHRDDIYIAITTGDAEALRDHISFPS